MELNHFNIHSRVFFFLENICSFSYLCSASLALFFSSIENYTSGVWLRGATSPARTAGLRETRGPVPSPARPGGSGHNCTPTRPGDPFQTYKTQPDPAGQAGSRGDNEKTARGRRRIHVHSARWNVAGPISASPRPGPRRPGPHIPLASGASADTFAAWREAGCDPLIRGHGHADSWRR